MKSKGSHIRLMHWHPFKRMYAGSIVGIFFAAFAWIALYSGTSVGPKEIAILVMIPVCFAALHCLVYPETRLVQYPEGWAIREGVAVGSGFCSVRSCIVDTSKPIKIDYIRGLDNSIPRGWRLGIPTTAGIHWLWCSTNLKTAVSRRQELQAMIHRQ